jgi:hypothetical protein
MRILIKITFVIIIIIFILYIILLISPFYRTTVLKKPFTFKSNGYQKYKFTVDKNETYFIEIQLKNNILLDEEIEELLSEYGRKEKNRKINVKWQIIENNKSITMGSCEDYNCSRFISKKYDGLTIGEFYGKKRNKYELMIKIDNSSKYDICDPIIEISLSIWDTYHLYFIRPIIFLILIFFIIILGIEFLIIYLLKYLRINKHGVRHEK